MPYSIVAFELPQNTIGQVVNLTCITGYEFADSLAEDADTSSGTDDDFLMKTRRKRCIEELVPQGGEWKDVDVVPHTCYSQEKLPSKRGIRL